jgi:glucose-6-phosphate 1-dehydrogenase
MTLERPGAVQALDRATTDLPLETVVGGDPLPPYVRLVHDVLIGDRTLFTRPDGLEDVWTVSAPILDAHPEPEVYAPGSWGPDAAERLADPVGWVLGEA